MDAMPERIATLRSRALRSTRFLDEEIRSRREASFAKTKGQPSAVREAKASAYAYRSQTITIHEQELIVGAPSGLQYDPSEITEPKTFARRTFTCPWPVREDIELLFNSGMLSAAGNHTTMDYATILSTGFEGLIERIGRRLAGLRPSEHRMEEKRSFLSALKIMAEGYLDYCRRYGDLAAELARNTCRRERRRELETIARNCRRVPAQTPTDFWQACQSLWFCFLFLPDAPGRVDQYLYPYYSRDLASGAIDSETARELLSCLWIKYFEYAGAQAGVSALQHLTLGGVGADGRDASNALTYLCLDVVEHLRLHRPQVGLRWNRNCPNELLERAVRVLRTQSGNPDFCNDEQIVPALTGLGVAPEDARDFSLSGCHEVIVSGKAQMGSVEGFINLPKILRLTIGLEPTLGLGTDPQTISSEEILWTELEKVMEFVAEGAHQASLARDERAAFEPGGNLAASLVVADCIENARGYTQGGARYNFCNWNIVGIANVVDALMAIRQLVFTDGTLSIACLAELLRRNWCQGEDLRQRVLKRVPQFGNDVQEVDEAAVRLIETFAAIMKKRAPFRGGEYILGTTAGGENMHIEFGRVTGATPDGRRDGEPLADSLGSAQGRDRRGVTALLNSVARLPHRLLPTATTLNVKLDPKLLARETDISRVAALIRAHFLSGGQQCQFNMVDATTLRAAKQNPDSYGNLMVRVAGYSAPFTALWEDLQDEIITRTEHAL